MARARTTQVEGMVRERTALLATTHGDVVEATQRVSILGDELMATHWARDAAEEKILSLAAKLATTDKRWEATEE
jgi:hypothetical protein